MERHIHPLATAVAAVVAAVAAAWVAAVEIDIAVVAAGIGFAAA